MDAAMHGVRNSLSAIRLGVDLLARRGDLNEADAVLEHIDSAAVRAHEQAEELADFCRLAAGRTIATVAKRFRCITWSGRRSRRGIRRSPAGSSTTASAMGTASATRCASRSSCVSRWRSSRRAPRRVAS